MGWTTLYYTLYHFSQPDVQVQCNPSQNSYVSVCGGLKLTILEIFNLWKLTNTNKSEIFFFPPREPISPHTTELLLKLIQKETTTTKNQPIKIDLKNKKKVGRHALPGIMTYFKATRIKAIQ